jgi:hypothetical protein
MVKICPRIRGGILIIINAFDADFIWVSERLM